MNISTPTPWTARLGSKVIEQPSGCHEWTGARRNGYGAIQIGTHDRPRVGYLHRLVWEQARGPIPADRQVAHLCHNRACVRLDHLALATRTENMQQSVAAGWPNGKPRVGKVAA